MTRTLFVAGFQPMHNGHKVELQRLVRSQGLEGIVIGVRWPELARTLDNPFTFHERSDQILGTLDVPVDSGASVVMPLWQSYRPNDCVDAAVKQCGKFKDVFVDDESLFRAFVGRGYSTELVSGDDRGVREAIAQGKDWRQYVPTYVAGAIDRCDGENLVKKLYLTRLSTALTADLVINYKNEGLVLVQRKNEPFKDWWALPGGFAEVGRETIEETALRECQEETTLRLRDVPRRLVGVYNTPGRDPRGPVTSVAYAFDVPRSMDVGTPQAADDAKTLAIFPVKELPKKLAFDHRKIIDDYIAMR